MSVRGELLTKATEEGWTTSTQVTLACDFIEEEGLEQDFVDWLEAKAQDGYTQEDDDPYYEDDDDDAMFGDEEEDL